MSGPLRLIARRLAFAVVTLFIVSVLIFLGVEALPGDLAQAILGQGATPETVAAIRKDLNLDARPMSATATGSAILHGDLGNSLANSGRSPR